MALITSCFIYNAWAIPLRQFFKLYQKPEHLKVWLFLDYLTDLIYFLDIVVVKYRIIFMKDGFWVNDKKELGIDKINYLPIIFDNNFIILCS